MKTTHWNFYRIYMMFFVHFRERKAMKMRNN